MLEYIYTPEYTASRSLQTKVMLNHNTQDQSGKGIKLL